MRDADELLGGLRRFYLDTALAASPTSLPSILALRRARPPHVRSDNRFANSQMSRWFTNQLDEYGLDEGAVDPALHQAVTSVGRPPDRHIRDVSQALQS